MTKLTGRCLCEAVAYEINELGPIYNCHCSKCRRWHGAAFRTRSSVEAKNFKWLSGEEHVARYKHGSTTKTFCVICGSSLISFNENYPEFLGVPLGGLEQDPGVRPIANIFVGSKSPWYDITDGLPQYEEWPPGGGAVVRGEKK